jgi:hypothetical protein
MKTCMYASCHKSCPLFAFEIVEKIGHFLWQRAYIQYYYAFRLYTVHITSHMQCCIIINYFEIKIPFCYLFYNNAIIIFLLQLMKSPQDSRISNLIVTRNFMETSQEFLLHLVLAEDLLWPEHILYLACYFWSKCQACQQIEKTMEEMSKAVDIFTETDSDSLTCSIEHQDLLVHQKQLINEVDPAAIKTYMEPFLPHIKLLTIESLKLEKILQEFSSFTPVEKCLIYSSFLDNIKFAYLPEEFCNLREPRSHPDQCVYIFGQIEDETKNLSVGELLYLSPTHGKFDANLASNFHLMQVVVKFPTQIKPPLVESQSYEELFSVILTNCEKEKFVTGPLRELADYNSSVLIKMHPPWDFHAGKGELSVTILHHKSGFYPTYKPEMETVSSRKGSKPTWKSVGFDQL